MEARIEASGIARPVVFRGIWEGNHQFPVTKYSAPSRDGTIKCHHSHVRLRKLPQDV